MAGKWARGTPTDTAHLLENLGAGNVGAALGQQEVAPVAHGHLTDLALLAHAGQVSGQNDPASQWAGIQGSGAGHHLWPQARPCSPEAAETSRIAFQHVLTWSSSAHACWPPPSPRWSGWAGRCPGKETPSANIKTNKSSIDAGFQGLTLSSHLLLQKSREAHQRSTAHSGLHFD